MFPCGCKKTLLLNDFVDSSVCAFRQDVQMASELDNTVIYISVITFCFGTFLSRGIDNIKVLLITNL